MGNVKISALPAAVSLSGSDLIVVVQSGTTKKATVSLLSGTPGGADKSIQFADSGVFNGFGSYDSVNKNILLDSTCTINYSGVTNGLAGGGSSSVGDAGEMTGQYGFAYGNTCQAKGDFSVAMGYHCIADGQGAVAMGFGSVATGQGAVAIGFGSIATGPVAQALGDGASASGTAAFATVEDNVAEADHATALGELSRARQYGEISHSGQGFNCPDSYRQADLFGHGAAAPVNLLLGNSTEWQFQDAKSYAVKLEILAVDQAASNPAAVTYKGLVHVTGGVVTIDNMVLQPDDNFNTPAYVFTISNPAATLKLRVNCDPGAATVNFLARLTVRALSGV